MEDKIMNDPSKHYLKKNDEVCIAEKLAPKTDKLFYFTGRL